MASKRPNFLVVVADDLGYIDIGPFGGEIQTPTLDKLAADGVRLANFYTASACSPTRAMLISGTDNHIAGLGQMAEYLRHVAPHIVGKQGYEGYLNWRVGALPEILQDAGYHTMMSGKWHLGMTKELAPCSRGFVKSFAFLPGSGNHHAWEPQFQEGVMKAPSMWMHKFWMEGDKSIDIDKDLPKDFYSTASFTDKMLGFLDSRTDEEREKPFFSYLAFTAPPWSLQAPREVVRKYEGIYKDGPDALTQRRLKRLQELGFIREGLGFAAPPMDMGPEWDTMLPEEQKASARKMEVFAGMVDMIDQNLGRLVDYLEKTGELDDTFILFMSDNGAEGLALEALPVMGNETSMAGIIDKFYNNEFKNMGEKDSFIWYGPRWASAATAPSRGVKTMILEGGIRCPCVVRYPGFNVPKGGAITQAFTTVMDILPTILELGGVPHPSPSFRGRDIMALRGKSWKQHLSSFDGDSLVINLEESSVHPAETHIHGWELFGERGIRDGPYKAVWMPPPRGAGTWQLFNVKDDPSELHDLGKKMPDRLASMVRHWETYCAETGLVEFSGPWFPEGI